MTNEKFNPDKKILETIKKDNVDWFNTKSIEIVVKIEKEVAHYFQRRDLLPNQRIEKELEDGGLIISCKTSFDKEVLSIIRYWIPNIEIISPNEIKVKLNDSLKNYLK